MRTTVWCVGHGGRPVQALLNVALFGWVHTLTAFVTLLSPAPPLARRIRSRLSGVAGALEGLRTASRSFSGLKHSSLKTISAKALRTVASVSGLHWPSQEESRSPVVSIRSPMRGGSRKQKRAEGLLPGLTKHMAATLTSQLDFR